MKINEDRLNQLDEFCNSKAGKQSIINFSNKIINEEEILNLQLERFHKWLTIPSKYGKDGTKFVSIVSIIKRKYNSNKYKDRWYNRSIEPPESLYWFLFEYATKYGVEPNKRITKQLIEQQIINMFTTQVYLINGYCFSRMDGQGSVIHIDKIGRG